GRRMSDQAVEQVARGRVWTGPQAHERGLVDGIGTFEDVVATARELAGIPVNKPHDLIWAAPREGLLTIARRLALSVNKSTLWAELDPMVESLLESLLLSPRHGALYYLPLVWR